MRTSVGSSVALHVAAVVVSVVGLPHLSRPIDMEEQPPIVAELVTISDVTNVPTRPKDPEPPKEEAKPEPPKPQPAPQKAETPPAPPPKPEPAPPQIAAAPPEPKPEAPKPEPKKEEPKPRPPEELAKLKAAKKPAPPKEDFDAVLKNLAKAAPKAEPKAEAKKSQQPSFEEMMAKALPSNRRNIGDPSKPITMTQKDALQNEFNKAMQRCWNIPAGAKDAASLVITVSASFAPDGTLVNARSDDVNASDPFRRAAAESAVRALRSCSPYNNLPSIANYEQWRDIDLRFNPKEILGG
jgi:outer membrane biosynthesis protein TonB